MQSPDSAPSCLLPPPTSSIPPPRWLRENILEHSSDPALFLPHDPRLPRDKGQTAEADCVVPLAVQALTLLWRMSLLPILAAGLGRTGPAPGSLGPAGSFLDSQCRLYTGSRTGVCLWAQCPCRELAHGLSHPLSCPQSLARGPGT